MPDARLERILITNDDGIDAPGLAVLEEVARDCIGQLAAEHIVIDLAPMGRPRIDTVEVTQVTGEYPCADGQIDSVQSGTFFCLTAE